MPWHTQAFSIEEEGLQCLTLFSTSFAESKPTISASGTSDMGMEVKGLLLGNSDSDDPPIPIYLFF
jgi:hypothetical protein